MNEYIENKRRKPLALANCRPVNPLITPSTTQCLSVKL